MFALVQQKYRTIGDFYRAVRAALKPEWFLKVLAIWSSNSTRSVTTTKVQLPSTLRSTFWAKNTIEKLLPLPWVCQNTPARPCPRSRASSIEAMALLTPRNWWF
jgi:hypothetical protein